MSGHCTNQHSSCRVYVVTNKKRKKRLGSGSRHGGQAWRILGPATLWAGQCDRDRAYATRVRHCIMCCGRVDASTDGRGSCSLDCRSRVANLPDGEGNVGTTSVYPVRTRYRVSPVRLLLRVLLSRHGGFCYAPSNEVVDAEAGIGRPGDPVGSGDPECNTHGWRIIGLRPAASTQRMRRYGGEGKPPRQHQHAKILHNIRKQPYMTAPSVAAIFDSSFYPLYPRTWDCVIHKSWSLVPPICRLSCSVPHPEQWLGWDVRNKWLALRTLEILSANHPGHACASVRAEGAPLLSSGSGTIKVI